MILQCAILAIAGLILVFLYRQTKKRGFMLIGIIFILEAIYSFIPNQAITNILIHNFGMNDREAFGALVQIIQIFGLIFEILFLIGIIFLRREFKSKPTQ